jgi:hypothetical protein
MGKPGCGSVRGPAYLPFRKRTFRAASDALRKSGLGEKTVVRNAKLPFVASRPIVDFRP